MTSLQNKTSRQTKLESWLNTHFLASSIEIHPIKNDASFRQYYRCTINHSSYVVMDAPPDKEKIDSFIKITKILSQFNILVPDIVACDIENGFMVLSDFGDIWLLERLKQASPAQVLTWYKKAIQGLIQIQQIPVSSDKQFLNDSIPVFDAAHISLELSYFSDWFLGRLLTLSLSPAQQAIIQRMSDFLIQSALSEPQVLIHRDYHSRNLMVLANDQLGIIDYQDAMVGPQSYDLASLLKDCYIVWSQAQVNECVAYFYQKSYEAGLFSSASLEEFNKSFDLMALQRHLKVLGVFARLNIRDHKSHYMNDMPRIIQYVLNVIAQYPELSEFQVLWQQLIFPAFSNYQALREVNACVP